MCDGSDDKAVKSSRGNKTLQLHRSHSNMVVYVVDNYVAHRQMFEEFYGFELPWLNLTPLPKHLDVDRDRDHLKIYNVLNLETKIVKDAH